MFLQEMRKTNLFFSKNILLREKVCWIYILFGCIIYTVLLLELKCNIRVEKIKLCVKYVEGSFICVYTYIYKYIFMIK